MNYPAAEQRGIGRHAGLNPASILNTWIPVGVYPDKNRGRNDNSRQAAGN